jgi:hypothetical protein
MRKLSDGQRCNARYCRLGSRARHTPAAIRFSDTRLVRENRRGIRHAAQVVGRRATLPSGAAVHAWRTASQMPVGSGCASLA